MGHIGEWDSHCGGSEGSGGFGDEEEAVGGEGEESGLKGRKAGVFLTN